MTEEKVTLYFQHDFDPNSGHQIELKVKCRLGAAPSLLQKLIESSIKPLAERYDPHWHPSELPVTPPDESE